MKDLLYANKLVLTIRCEYYYNQAETMGKFVEGSKGTVGAPQDDNIGGVRKREQIILCSISLG